jgi:hypothetical protein
MKLTKKEALVEAPDFFFPLVPAQPLMIEVEMKDEKGFFIFLTKEGNGAKLQRT